MKRLFFALSLFAGISSIALLTLSCSDNDDDKNKPLLTLTDTFSSATKDGVVMTLSTLNSESEPTILFAGLIAYNLLPKKPEMNIEIIDKSRLIA